MKIAITGSRGIPNNYGGFEQFADFLAVDLAEKGHHVIVYNSHSHPYKGKEYKGVELVHCYDPEDHIGLAGQFIYDFNCISDAKKRDFDIILQLGYTTSSVWGWMLPKKPVLAINMDGVEWMRSKYPKIVQWFLKHAERWATNTNDYLIADSIGIQQHLSDLYAKKSIFIPYGSYVFEHPDKESLMEYDLTPLSYNMLIARLQSDNSVDVILEGIVESGNKDIFLVVGNNNTKYGRYLRNKYESQKNIRFIGGVYDQEKLNNLRYFSNLYFHGHRVGGTNPSLLEAMGSNGLICAYDNIFNRAILGEEAFYFRNSTDVAFALGSYFKRDFDHFLESNRKKIHDVYHWPLITNQYENFFKSILYKKTL
ncbi:DUF1972 domain-containing protein [Spirosoma pomorum]